MPANRLAARRTTCHRTWRFVPLATLKGAYPAYQRLNISMACNHCDNPVCLKGCPTRAYTKFAEYGAVLQDPNICFGCGYCTWVCPYNAPQLDPVEGQVQKCNMCVDRLEVGLKPACAAACLAGALDFGIIETTPENRHQTQTSIPGFPTPDITHPNIRFQQTRSLPRELTRPDTMPVRYERDEQGPGAYKTKVRKSDRSKHWSFGQLRTREDPLVIFTLISQAVVGAFLTLFLGPRLGYAELSTQAHPLLIPTLLFLLLGAQTFALVLSTMHLGKPHRFYRAFNNLRYSPVSREVAGIAVFYNLLGAYALIAALPELVSWLPTALAQGIHAGIGWLAVVAGPTALYFMYRIYRIPARPFWNHWQTLSAFFGNMLALGPMLVGTVVGIGAWAAGIDPAPLLSGLAVPIAAGLALEALGLYAQARDLGSEQGEGAASMVEQGTRFGKTYQLRNVLLGLGLAAFAAFAASQPGGDAALVVWLVASLLITVAALIGRALFYALVIPTTMPGAFFWKNQGFQEHARHTGLSDMPQTGVIADGH